MSKTISLLAAAGFVFCVIEPAAAQTAAQDISPEHVRALIAKVTQQGVPQPSGAAPIAAGAQGMDLTVEEAVRRALERNLDLQVQRLSPRLLDFSLASVLASYRPTLNSTMSAQSSTDLPTNQAQGVVSQFNSDTLRWDYNVQQLLPWYGGNFRVSWNNNRVETTNTTTLRNPAYASTFQGVFTQPLLRNFRTDPNRTNLLTTRISQEIEDINLKATIVNTEAAVRNAYWDLVYTVQNIEAVRRSLELATTLVQQNQARVEIGTMAPIDVVQAQAEEANRRQALVAAENANRTAELTLKRLIVGGTDDELWRATINPVDRPSPVAEPIDLEGAVTTALKNRTDLHVSRKTLESNELAIKNLRNQTLPDLNLTTTYQLQGRGGTETRRGSFGGDVTQIIPGGYIDALRNISGFDAPTWSFQLNLIYPIGQSAADINLARTRVQLQQINAQIKQAELQVATDVTTAAVNVRNSLESVEAAQKTRELSEKRLEAVQSKFDVGMATNYEVVQAQRDLQDARTSELRNLLNYRKALVEFERSQVTGNARTVTSIR